MLKSQTAPHGSLLRGKQQRARLAAKRGSYKWWRASPKKRKKRPFWGLPAQPPVASQMPTGSTAVTCQAQGYTWRRPLDRTTTESAHGHMLAHHHPCTQRRHPLLPLKESTHNKALLSPEDKVFVCCRLKHHEASTRQAAWPNLGTSGARKPHFWVISRRPQRGWRKHSMPAR
jgi:hypothetical protein